MAEHSIDSRDRKIAAFCEAAIAARTTPGCVVGYVRNGKTCVLPFGGIRYEASAARVNEQTAYDVASITKSIPTSSIILKLAEQGRIRLDDKVTDYLPELENDYRDEILIRHLLTFTVCFDFGKTLASVARENPEGVLDTILKAPLMEPPGMRYVYSNAPSLLLGVIAERTIGQRLDAIAQDWFFEPLGMQRTGFDPSDWPRDDIAPTEVDWRGEVQGTVHDPAAWALMKHGMIPAHAGLFSTAGDLLRFAQMLLNEGEFENKRILEPETVRLMGTNQTPHLAVRAGLGWEIDRKEAQGHNVSAQAFGKTGFTGTSIVIDPQKQAAMVLLSNRTYPQRGERETILAFWSGLADIVFGD